MATKTTEEKSKKTCGIVMPISSHVDYPSDHWNDVLSILFEAIGQTEFEAKLVSDDVAIGLIHDRIVTNLYTNEIVVCDVSSKNPNVMFELGLRLAFDKPTIIIKDELTGYSFDTGVIEHISYPSSLSFKEIVKFKDELAKRITATYLKSMQEPKFSPFLGSFGKNIIPSTIQQKDVTDIKYMSDLFMRMREDLQVLRVEQRSLTDKMLSELNYGRHVADADRFKALTEERIALKVELEKIKQVNDSLTTELKNLKSKMRDQ